VDVQPNLDASYELGENLSTLLSTLPSQINFYILPRDYKSGIFSCL